MKFSKLELADAEILRPYFSSPDDEKYGRLCEYSFGSPFLWRGLYNVEFCVDSGVLFLRTRYEASAQIMYSVPMGGEGFAENLARLRAYTAGLGEALSLTSISEAALPEVLAACPGGIVTTDPDWYDYMYAASDLRDFPGRKYSKKRNHINKFLSLYPDWRIAPISDENTADAIAFIEADFAANPKEDYPAYIEGAKMSLDVLKNRDVYGFSGVLLYVGAQAVGVALGETRGDTLYVHTEKASTEIVGAYQMLVREYARFAGEHILFVNREEDDGVPGLRASKESYFPCALLKKYSVDVPL
ncbi:MAG: phosphatidylglycerol lysyltransferase domain-containing protein [Oscillospiraceae bacterium]|jgi:hypothetical protein|nr:phosphatidylglycerol lysyltransferase domain-containing protein [Oscillospiraceae bacterium]